MTDAPGQAALMRSGAYVGVVGPSEATSELRQLGYDVGERLARSGCVLVCGGLEGVMAAACEGALAAGGLTVGLLPQDHRGAANPYLSVALPTGLGELRNALIVRSSDAVVAIGGSWGTLSEVALAVRTGKPVVAVRSWRVLETDTTAAVSGGPAVATTVEELFVLLERALRP